MLADCVIFDLDGTLVDSVALDQRIYMAAVRDLLGQVTIRPGWIHYEHVTDAGVFASICDDNDIDPIPLQPLMRAHFGELIATQLRSEACAAVAGALTFVRSLQCNPHCAVGIATGGWGHTAHMKLATAGFELDGIPLSSSDHSFERVRIMRHCRERLAPARSTVYVGDGEWDRQAAASLGWRFVGVGESMRGLCANWIPHFLTPDCRQVVFG